MKETALKLVDPSLIEFEQTLAGEGGRCLIVTSESRNLLEKRPKEHFLRTWCPGRHIGFRWEMIQSSMCLLTNSTSNTLQCILDELRSRNRELNSDQLQILFLVRVGHVTLSVPLCCGFTSLPDADPFLVNTERRLSVWIKLISGQIIVVWFYCPG